MPDTPKVGVDESGAKKVEHPERNAYYAARQRCTDPNHTKFKYYGGRGIEFRFKTFAEFYVEVGPKPSPRHSLDRIKGDGHYEPGNVRWATWPEQTANRRPGRGLKTSSYRGVARHGTSWGAYIFHKGKQTRLGSFRNEVEAARAYDSAALQTWGSEAVLNFPAE